MTSPQDDKRLSYARDRRNTYGQNAKASRTAIPARKAAESRRVRRKAAQALGGLVGAPETEAEVVESSLAQDVERLGGWRKSPDTPLGIVLARKSPETPNAS